jgi:hypothetical protein
MDRVLAAVTHAIRHTFVGCCVSALAPHIVSANTIVKSTAHFRFWILDFRL